MFHFFFYIFICYSSCLIFHFKTFIFSQLHFWFYSYFTLENEVLSFFDFIDIHNWLCNWENSSLINCFTIRWCLHIIQGILIKSFYTVVFLKYWTCDLSFS